jgi:hypothetical protein
MQPAAAHSLRSHVCRLRREIRQVHALTNFEIEICSGHCGGRNSAKPSHNRKTAFPDIQNHDVKRHRGFFRLLWLWVSCVFPLFPSYFDQKRFRQKSFSLFITMKPFPFFTKTRKFLRNRFQINVTP